MTAEEIDNLSRNILIVWGCGYLLVLPFVVVWMIRDEGTATLRTRGFWLLMVCLPVSYIALFILLPPMLVWSWWRRDKIVRGATAER